MLDNDLLTFIRGSIRSVWALELLLFLRKQAPRAVGAEELVRELRATAGLVSTCVKQLEASGLVACEKGGCRYAPASPALEALSTALEQLYRERPVAVIDAIMSSPSDRLKNFADAFRFKEKDE